MRFSGFDWDSGNRDKGQKHGVSIVEIESVFDGPLIILPDHCHSRDERRMRAIGKDVGGRSIFVVFTLRTNRDSTLIRPLSARYMHRKEVASYEKAYPEF